MSMKQLSVNVSQITGGAKAKRAETGTQLTETGSAKPLTLGRPDNPLCLEDPRDELPQLLRPIVPKGTASLISWLRFSLIPLDDRLVKKAIVTLEALKAQHLEIRKPATNEEFLEALMMIADTIQVELPTGHGLFVYTALLQKLPKLVLQEAILHVMKTHTFRTMPLPAEILAAPAVGEWEMTNIWLEKFCSRHLALLKARV